MAGGGWPVRGGWARCGDFEDSSTLISGNLVTGHLNLRNALLREIDFSAPRACAQGNRGPGRGARLMITASPGCWIQVATTLVRVGAR